MSISIEEASHHYYKLCIWNDVANQLAYYGVQCGNEMLMDKIDLSCGAIPEGPFEQVIDLAAPDQFLKLYTQIVENRFAMAVTELLNMNNQLLKPIQDFCFKVGQSLGVAEITSAEIAFSAYNDFVLDGIPDQSVKQVTESSAAKIAWKKLSDPHADAWEKTQGDLSVYYNLLECFVNGLFSRSKIQFKILDQTDFILELV